MIKCSRGHYIEIHSVVVDERGNLYSVESYDHTRENFIRCRNGCVVTYYKPEHLKCVNCTRDLEE